MSFDFCVTHDLDKSIKWGRYCYRYICSINCFLGYSKDMIYTKFNPIWNIEICVMAFFI